VEIFPYMDDLQESPFRRNTEPAGVTGDYGVAFVKRNQAVAISRPYCLTADCLVG